MRKIRNIFKYTNLRVASKNTNTLQLKKPKIHNNAQEQKKKVEYTNSLVTLADYHTLDRQT